MSPYEVKRWRLGIPEPRDSGCRRPRVNLFLCGRSERVSSFCRGSFSLFWCGTEVLFAQDRTFLLPDLGPSCWYFLPCFALRWPLEWSLRCLKRSYGATPFPEGLERPICSPPPPFRTLSWLIQSSGPQVDSFLKTIYSYPSSLFLGPVFKPPSPPPSPGFPSPPSPPRTTVRFFLRVPLSTCRVCS